MLCGLEEEGGYSGKGSACEPCRAIRRALQLPLCLRRIKKRIGKRKSARSTPNCMGGVYNAVCCQAMLSCSLLYYTLSRLYVLICYLKCKINSSPSVLLKGGKARGSSKEEGPLQQGVPSKLSRGSTQGDLRRLCSLLTKS